MKTIRLLCLLISACCLSAFAQGTAFTYQGHLNDGGSPANGNYDLTFALFQFEAGGNAFNPIQTNLAVVVSGGLFTATPDFGPGQFTGQPRWLQIGVRTNGVGTFIPLSPRQALLPTPYAILATDIRDGAVSAAKIADGAVSGVQLANNSVSAAKLQDNAVTSAKILNGTIVNADVAADAALADSKLATLSTAGKVANSATTASSENVANAIVARDASGNFAAATITASGDLQAGRLNVGSNHQLTGFGATIAGGLGNTNQGLRSSIGGGYRNTIQTDADYAHIGGGYQNTIETNTGNAFIGGGFGNTIQSSTWRSSIGGGGINLIQTRASDATVGGGFWNTIQTNAASAVIAGGSGNVIQTNAAYAALGGGFQNTNSGQFAVVPGGYQNVAGADYAFAAGRRAKATNQGAFVWADSFNADFQSTSNNQFSVRARGGVRIETAGAGLALDGQPVLSGTVTSADISDGAVTATKIASNAVTSAAIADGAVTSAKIASNSVGATQLADNAVTSAKILDGTIVNADLAAGAAVADTKLATLSTAGKVANSATTATSANTANAIVARDASGNFSAGTISAAALSASGNVSAGGDLLGDRLNVGSNHQLSGTYSTIAGGQNNTNLASWSSVGGGNQNIVQGNATYATIAGGRSGNVGPSASYAFVGGGSDSVIQSNATYATIAGGRYGNVGPAASYAFLGGGYQNLIQSNATYSAIAGGRGNSVEQNTSYGFVGGGYQNTIETDTDHAVLAGGRDNTIQSAASYASLAGGYLNTNGGQYAALGGGSRNFASGNSSVISGGWGNQAPGADSSVGGGLDNVAGGSRSVVPGGYLNEAAGNYSLAAGRQAKALHSGTFVWGDSTGADFSSTANNQFLVRASGGVGFGTASPAGDLHVRGHSADASLIVGAGAGNGNAELFLAEDLGTTLGMILRYEGNANQLQVLTRSSGVDSDPKVVINRDNGRVGIGTNSPVSALHVNGTATVSVLSITGGADLAEPIPATGDPIPKGALVVIDDENPGCVKMSRTAYDTRVAGIISGANGVSPGITLRQEAVLDGGQLVALSGRVYALADASLGPIKPGDLLTTSPTPGHAMKVTDTQKAPGAVLGKAMTGLGEGRGLVLVLVTLQ